MPDNIAAGSHAVDLCVVCLLELAGGMRHHVSDGENVLVPLDLQILVDHHVLSRAQRRSQLAAGKGLRVAAKPEAHIDEVGRDDPPVFACAALLVPPVELLAQQQLNSMVPKPPLDMLDGLGRELRNQVREGVDDGHALGGVVALNLGRQLSPDGAAAQDEHAACALDLGCLLVPRDCPRGERGLRGHRSDGLPVVGPRRKNQVIEVDHGASPGACRNHNTGGADLRHRPQKELVGARRRRPRQRTEERGVAEQAQHSGSVLEVLALVDDDDVEEGVVRDLL
mmetsp:Transcript_22732/g.65493  ORF Transcript_22732/g.65493 Transcript_22732/m.65493 type:complete len:282 (-) Transcript_22732:322-1167(-)